MVGILSENAESMFLASPPAIPKLWADPCQRHSEGWRVMRASVTTESKGRRSEYFKLFSQRKEIQEIVVCLFKFVISVVSSCWDYSPGRPTPKNSYANAPCYYYPKCNPGFFRMLLSVRQIDGQKVSRDRPKLPKGCRVD